MTNVPNVTWGSVTLWPLMLSGALWDAMMTGGRGAGLFLVVQGVDASAEQRPRVLALTDGSSWRS